MNEDNQLQEKIVELENQIHELEKDLIHDSLTGLKTRAFFEEELKVYISSISNSVEGKRRDWFGFKNLSVLFFDIDFFKKINDKYGHDVGDMVLRKVAETVNKSVREGDTAARWGGEEMVSSLLGANEADAKGKAESIRKQIEELTFPQHRDLTVTISIGVATYSKGMNIGELIKNADLSLYRAKDNGRNQVVAFSEL
ncbi:MAG: GGDEF domain-containing protein [Parcubacteria group bacterium]